MALAGLKKQFNKANQYMNEKIGGVEGTKFTDEFTQLERRTDLTAELVDELINRTKEYLQPNPASRTKLMVSSKLKGAPGKPHSYPQPEGILAEAMCKYGKEINEDSSFAKSLTEMGEALREMAEVKYALEDNVKQNFLEPLTHLQAKDLKDVLFHRKKLEGRRLDYDCKKRKRQKGTHFAEEEIRMAEDKLEESFNLASMGMHNLFQNEIEQMSQICVLSEALYEYHSQCANILESLNARLLEIKNDAAHRTFQPYVPKKLHELNLNVPNAGHDDLSPGDAHMNGSKFYICDSKSSTASKCSQNNKSKALSSSPLSMKSGKVCNGFSNSNNNNNNNSTISFLLNQPTITQQNNHFQTRSTLSHSKSLLNVSNLNSWDTWDSDPIFNDNNKTNNNDHNNQLTNNNNNSSNYRALNNILSGYKFESNPDSAWEITVTNHNNNNIIINHDNNYKNDTYSTDKSKFTNNIIAQDSSISSSTRTPTDARGPCCQALYDFDAENDNEINFKEGDIIHLVSQVDDNWYEGTINGRTGLFPVSYVQVLVPL